jgi:hypothetical protein
MSKDQIASSEYQFNVNGPKYTFDGNIGFRNAEATVISYKINAIRDELPQFAIAGTVGTMGESVSIENLMNEPLPITSFCFGDKKQLEEY